MLHLAPPLWGRLWVSFYTIVLEFYRKKILYVSYNDTKMIYDKYNNIVNNYIIKTKITLCNFWVELFLLNFKYVFGVYEKDYHKYTCIIK